MQVTEAIKLLELNVKEAGPKMPPDCKAALLLGIQALSRHHQRVNLTYTGMLELLPGETLEFDKR